MAIHTGGHLKKYLSKTPWYLISSISTKLMGFILLPVYTRYLSQEEIGILSVYESMGKIILVILSLYIDAAFVRFYYKVKAHSADRLAVFFSSHFWFVLFWGAGASVILCLFVIERVPKLPPANALLIPALVLSLLFTQLIVMLTSVWAANLFVKRLAGFNVLFSMLVVLATILLIIYTNTGWESKIYSLFIISFIQLIVVVIIVMKKKWLLFTFDTGYIITSLKYSIPLLPNVIAGWIAMLSDRLIMSYYGELDQVGIYSIAAQIALVLYIINDSVTKIQGPLAMSGMTDDAQEAKGKMSSFVHLYLSVMVFLYVFTSTFIPTLVNFAFGPDYYEVKNIFLILGWVYILSGIYRVFTNVISFHEATWVISLGAILQAIINIALNFLLIPHYGMYAAAISTVSSMAIYTLWLTLWSQNLDKIDLKHKKLILITFLGVGFAAFLFMMDESGLDNHLIFLCKLLALPILAVILLMSQDAKVKEWLVKLLRLR